MLSARTLLVSSLRLASCAMAAPEEAALRDMPWDVSTRWAGGKNILQAWLRTHPNQ